MIRSLFSLSVGLVLFSTSSLAQTTVTPTYPDITTFLWGNTSVNAPGQTSKVNGTGYTYRYLLPKNFNPSARYFYPTIIYLHGANENGTDGQLPLQANNNTADGALAMVSTANPDNYTDYPCFFIVPQVPVGTQWSSDAAATEITNLLNTLQTQYPNAFDSSRVCLTGLSEGGTACYDLPYLMKQGNHLGANPFACSVPMSANFGQFIPRAVSTQPYMPLWIFHAADDASAPVANDDAVVAGLRSRGYSVVYSRYQTGEHAIGELAYQHPELLPWMFAQYLVQPPTTLANFAITGESPWSNGTSVSLIGTADTAEGFTSITWTDDVNSGSGSASGPITPTWSIPNIPIAAGTNHLQVTATAPNNTAAVFGMPANYGGNVTDNIPFTVSPTINLALNKPVTVSSVDSSAHAGNFAVDGDPTTRWSSAYSDNQWIEIDLGANYDLREVDLTWETACGKDYQIQTSTDNVNWTTQTTVTGNTRTGLLQYYYAVTLDGTQAPSARYLRIYGTARATQWGYSLYEVAVYAQDSTASTFQTTNVALHKQVTVSSVDDPANAGSNAVDGFALTRWSSAYSDPQWITVDLGANYDIDDVDLTWETAYGKNYLIQTSLDGVNWTTQTTVTGNTSPGFISYPYFFPITCRYVRVYGTARGTGWGYSLYELAVYGVPTPRNLALNGTATASSVETPSLGASNAIDGNLSTRWSSAYSDPQWIEVDLGTLHGITGVSLNWETACGKDYLIQTSTDDVNWTTATTVTGNTSTGLLQYSYATPVVGRYVRMYGTARATTWGYSLYEMSVLGR